MWATYVCEHRGSCGWRGTRRSVWFDLTHPHGWTPNLMAAALRESGWTYLPQRSFRWEDPHGWRCPDHSVATPGLEPGNPPL